MKNKLLILSLAAIFIIVSSASNSGFETNLFFEKNNTVNNEQVKAQVVELIKKNFNIYPMDSFKPYEGKISFDDSELIDEFTWSVLRYDHLIDSENFGKIYTPKPSQGAILIPANMMSIPVCKTAVLINHENKWDTLLALEEYDVDNMIHTDTAFIDGYNEWESPSVKSTYRKESAEEMDTLGKLCLKADLVGDCYAQASFNTAVLRLCGFTPEEVFTITILGHAVNIIKIEEKWYVFDSVYSYWVKKGYFDSLIFEFYDPPLDNYIMWLENDKYFINFGFPDNYHNKPYCNIDPEILSEIVDQIVPIFNNSKLGYPGIKIEEFIENAEPCPDMASIAIPYTVNDAQGSTLEEKAQFLSSINKEYVLQQCGGEYLNQYDKSCYILGMLSVKYPQAYANAAKYAAWTSYFGVKRDLSNPIFDLLITVLWIRMNVFNKQVMPYGNVAFSDLLYLRHAGSTIDQAVLAYGTLRNMKKDNDFWQPEDLYIILTEDYNGYLAVNITNDWEYLNFGKGKLIQSDPPENLKMSFNEIDCLGIWEE